MHTTTPKKRLLAALALLLALGTAGTGWAQPNFPPAIQGLPDYGAVAYTPGLSIGPLGPIENPDADADYIRWAREFWQFVDSNGTYTAPLQSFQWTAPELVDLGDSSDGARTQVDPWGGGFVLFAAIYQHRIQPADPTGPNSIYDLVSSDPTIALYWKHWTFYHQLVTDTNADPVAHQAHVNLVSEALGPAINAKVRGVPYYNGPVLVSDRLDILLPGAVGANPSPNPLTYNQASLKRMDLVPFEPGLGLRLPLEAQPSDPDVKPTDPATVQACIDNHAGDLAGKRGLYKPDTGYSAFGLSGGEPGFDCDDFADAIGAKLTKGKPGVTYTNVFVTFTSTNPANGKSGKAGHMVTRVNSGGQYWLVDAQTGNTSGPHADGTPMDASGVVQPGYNADPGSINTDQTQHPPGDRSAWQGPWSGEPDPWYTSEEIKACFEKITGEPSGGYIL